jgi:hypothetical protein
VFIGAGPESAECQANPSACICTQGENGNRCSDGTCRDSFALTASVARTQPKVLLVLDRSGSMDASLGGGTSKYNAVSGAVQQLVNQRQGSVEFGLSLYPDGGASCGTGRINVGTALSQGANIANILNSSPPSDGRTPTASTLAAAASYFANVGSNQAKFVLLATDGVPNCRAGAGDPDASDDANTLAAVRSLRARGVRTFVLGIGQGTQDYDPGLLNRLADAGGTARNGSTKFYEVGNQAALGSALESAISTASNCIFPLKSAVTSDSEIGVSIGANPVTRDPSHVNGWDFDPSSNTISFYGNACSTLSSQPNISVYTRYSCPQ